ncbi:hypothetical protein [Kitasatospora aureofaciens]|uniref:hypothetical protein n=1 Tax=Kitasatospora aureofaciens TaxID=1894 RepID=UPI00382DA689
MHGRNNPLPPVVQEILKGSVVEHFGAPVVVSTEIKGEEDFPRKHWWITEPVARALALAEAISSHPERLFTGIAGEVRNAERFTANEGIKAFVKHVNARTDVNGLEPIPSERVAPHMFRRTMAMLTDQFSGCEIALGIQLKHVASRALTNRTTQGYAASAASWAEHLDAADRSRPVPRPAGPVRHPQDERADRLRPRRRAADPDLRQNPRHRRCPGR